MYGGNDGLNTVVPYADPAYHDARPELAYTAEEVLHLDAQLGLNPAMKGMAALWRQRSWPSSAGSGTRSRTTATSGRWTSGRPRRRRRRSTRGGSAGGSTPPATTRCCALNIGEVLPPLAVGAKATAAALIGREVDVAGLTAAALKGLGDAGRRRRPGGRSSSWRRTRPQQRCEQTFGPLDPTDAGDEAGGGRRRERPAALSTAQLDVVARCIKAGVPTRVYAVSASGIRHPRRREGRPDAQLTEVDTAITASSRHGRVEPASRTWS